MSRALYGHRIAMLATDGVAQVELSFLTDRFRLEGASVAIASPRAGRIWTTVDDLTPGNDIAVTHTVDSLTADVLGALVIPSGIVSASRLRVDPAAVALISEVRSRGGPLAARGDAVALLIEAQCVRHRRISALPRWRTDVRNAGGVPVNEPVVVDDAVITSAGPGHLEQFWVTVRQQITDSSNGRSEP